MITAGIDMGLVYIKVVIMQDGKVIGRACGESGGAGRAAAVEAVYGEALTAAGIGKDQVAKVFARGKGKYDVPFADDHWTEPITLVLAAKYLCPEATMVVDCGADETLVSTIKDGQIGEFTINQKCAAGLGIFLENIAARMEMSVDELGKCPAVETALNEGCVVFSELDALSMLNKGVDVKTIAGACNFATAARAALTVNDITHDDRTCFLMVGGMTKNGAFTKALEDFLGLKFVIPEDAEYAGAIGAALKAAE